MVFFKNRLNICFILITKFKFPNAGTKMAYIILLVKCKFLVIHNEFNCSFHLYFQTLTESLSQFFQQEVKPSLLLEIENIIEKKIRPLGNQNKYPVIPHCQTCSCLSRGEMTEPDLNHEYTDIRRGKPYPQPQRPSSCNFVYNEEKKLLEKEVKLFAVGDFLDSGDGTVIPLAINNSFYHTADQTQHGKQLIKYGSDLDTGHSVALARANTFSGVAKGVQLSRSERNDIENNHRGI